MNYNYQDAPRESQQEYFGNVHTDNKETLQNALKRIEELEQQIEKMQCCENCKRYKPCITCNETIGNNCDYYNGGNVCNNWQLN